MIADLDAQSGREAAAAIGRNGGAASFVEVDATDEESVRAGVEATVREFGNLEILVNSGGGGAPASDEREPWHFAIDIFLKAPCYACKYAIPEMERAGRGAIVNIGAREPEESLRLSAQLRAEVGVRDRVGALTRLPIHVRGALHHGATREEIEEVLLTVMGYAGHGLGTSALAVAREVLDEEAAGSPPSVRS